MEIHPEVKYIETSAKTAEKVEDAFKTIAEMLLEQQTKSQEKSKSKNKGKSQEHGKKLNHA